MTRVTTSVISALIAIVTLLLMLHAFGFPIVLTAPVLVRGSVGSSFALTETVLRSVPLLLTALSVLIAFRAGVWNIGAEGQFIIGAIAAFSMARVTGEHWIAVPLSMLAAMLGGAAWAGLAAFLKARRNAPEVLTTILLNFVAIHLLGYVANGPLKEAKAQYPQTDLISGAAALPTLGAGRLHAGPLIAILCAAFLYWLLLHSRAGLRMRAVGSNPRAAAFAGINVNRETAVAFLLSGAIAGLAGGIELAGITHRLFERFAVGYGYSGITVALLAQLHPLAAIGSSFFIAALRTGCAELQRAIGVAAAVATLGEGLVVISLLMFAAPYWRRRLESRRAARTRDVRGET